MMRYFIEIFLFDLSGMLSEVSEFFKNYSVSIFDHFRQKVLLLRNFEIFLYIISDFFCYE